MIKKTDKGSNVVIQNLGDYISEGLRQLGDEKFYRMLDYDPTEEFRKNIHKELERMFADKEISEKTFFFLMKGGKDIVYSICFQRSIKINFHLQADQLFLVLIAKQKRFLCC